MSQTSHFQDLLLSKLRQTRTGVTVFLVNGFQLRGQVCGFDAFVVLLTSDGRQQMIYKHAISTIVPERAIALQEDLPHPGTTTVKK